MKYRFVNINLIRKYIFILIISLFIFIYLYCFIKYDYFRKLFIKNNKNELSKERIATKVVYDSLSKIIDYDSIINSSKVTNIKKVSIIAEEKKEEIKEEKPIIYIYNTHESETYTLPFISDYSVTPNVKLASYILKDHLNDLNIASTVEKRSIKTYLNKNKLDYSYSYSASRSYMKDELKKYDYKILIDLHRDSATKKYTLYENNNKKYARVMFVMGHDYSTYKKNEKFVNDLNDRLNKKLNGISRGIFVRKTSRFNQDLSERAILLELGGVDNTLDEINNTLEVFAKVLKEYIDEEIYGRRK